jgi:FeS assembly SUF system protein
MTDDGLPHGASDADAVVDGGHELKATFGETPEWTGDLETDVIAAIRTVYDPEIPCNIYDLGLIYRIDVSNPELIDIDMTLTAPGCPVAGEFLGWVNKAVSQAPGVSKIKINLVFDPPWDSSKMSEEAKLDLGFL